MYDHLASNMSEADLVSKRLPPLIFGEREAKVDVGFHGMVDKFSHLTPDCDYDSKARAGFFYKGNVVDVGGIVINQTYYGHMLAVSSVKDHNILIPLAGVHNGIWRGQKLTAHGNQGYFIPANDKFLFETNLEGVAGSLIIKYDLHRLNAVLMVMTSGEHCLPAQDKVRELPLLSGVVSFKQLFIRLLSQIDGYNGDTELLKLAGFEDSFYRMLAITLFPTYFIKPTLTSVEQQITRKQNLMAVFERYVQEHLDGPIWISELEAVLGVSARALQYACMKRFGCSPRVYIRNCKLQLALERLQASSEPIKIAHLAAELGFASQSQFTKFFREKFGVLPSEV